MNQPFNAAFTPGPWRIVREGRGRVLLKPEKGGQLGTQIAQLFSYQDTFTEDNANMRLIAAAPVLFAALKDAHGCATLKSDGTCAGCSVSEALALVSRPDTVSP